MRNHINKHATTPSRNHIQLQTHIFTNWARSGVECYGGGLWNTWFDRDLSIAGRVLVRQEDGTIAHKLMRVDEPVLRIPNLAIHLNVCTSYGLTSVMHLVN